MARHPWPLPWLDKDCSKSQELNLWVMHSTASLLPVSYLSLPSGPSTCTFLLPFLSDSLLSSYFGPSSPGLLSLRVGSFG